MKSKNLTGYLVDVLDDLSGPITISNTLDALYNVLNCDLIDITYLTLGEKEFCVIVDDEGLLKSPPKFLPSAKPERLCWLAISCLCLLTVERTLNL